jgi:hypothetical protein
MWISYVNNLCKYYFSYLALLRPLNARALILARQRKAFQI